jgi:hypothetical protein
MNDEANETRAQIPQLPSCMASEEAMVAPMEALRSIGGGQHPWWDRIWTLQEVILPSKALLLWGPLSIPWHGVAGAARSAANRQSSKLVVKMYRPHIVTLNHLLTQINGAENTRGKIEGPMQTVFRWAF